MRPGLDGIASIVLAIAGPVVAGPIFTEDFDDGVLDPIWTAFAEEPAILDVAEQNGRLDFPTGENDGAFASAGVIGTGWSLDVSQDFALEVDLHVQPPELPEGDVGLSISLAFEASIAAQEVAYGLDVDFARDDRGHYISFTEVRDGAEIDTTTSITAVDVTVYIQYFRAADTVSLSVTGPDDPNAILIEGLGVESGACDVQVALAAFDDGVVPALSADALWIDDLRVTAGRVISTCGGDLDCSGGVGFNDLTVLLGVWGPGFAVEADLDGDGSVGFNDLTRMLGAWGPCS